MCAVWGRRQALLAILKHGSSVSVSLVPIFKLRLSSLFLRDGVGVYLTSIVTSMSGKKSEYDVGLFKC